MTKYKTTLGHNWINVGTILSVNSGHKISLIDGSVLGVSKEKFNEWIADGWVNKLQVPEWTDDDMIDFGNRMAIAGRDESKRTKELFEKYKNSRP